MACGKGHHLTTTEIPSNASTAAHSKMVHLLVPAIEGSSHCKAHSGHRTSPQALLERCWLPGSQTKILFNCQALEYIFRDVFRVRVIGDRTKVINSIHFRMWINRGWAAKIHNKSRDLNGVSSVSPTQPLWAPASYPMRVGQWAGTRYDFETSYPGIRATRWKRKHD